MKIGSRVQFLRGVEEEQVPEGEFGTVVDIYPADDDMLMVVADCRPRIRLLFYANEIGRELVEINTDDAKGGVR